VLQYGLSLLGSSVCGLQTEGGGGLVSLIVTEISASSILESTRKNSQLTGLFQTYLVNYIYTQNTTQRNCISCEIV